MPHIKKVASRFLLPLEFYLGLTAVAWAISGGLSKGLLHATLKANHDDTTAWLLTLSAVGLAQIAASASEWLVGHQWDLWIIWRSARLRMWIAFVSALVWLWVIKMMIDTEFWETVFVLMIVAPASMGMQFWAFWENCRVRLAADETIPTSTIVLKR